MNWRISSNWTPSWVFNPSKLRPIAEGLLPKALDLTVSNPVMVVHAPVDVIAAAIRPPPLLGGQPLFRLDQGRLQLRKGLSTRSSRDGFLDLQDQGFDGL